MIVWRLQIRSQSKQLFEFSPYSSLNTITVKVTKEPGIMKLSQKFLDFLSRVLTLLVQELLRQLPELTCQISELGNTILSCSLFKSIQKVDLGKIFLENHETSFVFWWEVMIQFPMRHIYIYVCLCSIYIYTYMYICYTILTTFVSIRFVMFTNEFMELIPIQFFIQVELILHGGFTLTSVSGHSWCDATKENQNSGHFGDQERNEWKEGKNDSLFLKYFKPDDTWTQVVCLSIHILLRWQEPISVDRWQEPVSMDGPMRRSRRFVNQVERSETLEHGASGFRIKLLVACKEVRFLSSR